MATESKRLVILALVANAGIAITKFVAAGISGSSAMLSEAIHSVADSGNQLFLLRGHAASRYDASVQHPTDAARRSTSGASWSPCSSSWVARCCRSSPVLGRSGTPHGHGGEGFWLSLAVLGAAALFEGLIAFGLHSRNSIGSEPGAPSRRPSRSRRTPRSWWCCSRTARPSSVSSIAASGLITAKLTENAVWDGIASVLIGLLLAAVAWVLAVEMKSLLIGESATREERAKIRAAALSVGEARTVDRLLTMQLAPGRDTRSRWTSSLTMVSTGIFMESAIVEMEGRIAEAVPQATRIFIEPVNP